MEWGSAFHELLENPEKYKIDDAYIVNDKLFYHENIKQAFNYSYPVFPKEIRSNFKLTINNDIIIISGIADQLIGTYTIENKTRWSNYTLSDYFDAYQWRIYLKMFNSPVVIYQIFRMELQNDTAILKDVNCLKFMAYKNMENDIYKIISEFTEWINLKNLQTYFKDK